MLKYNPSLIIGAVLSFAIFNYICGIQGSEPSVGCSIIFYDKKNKKYFHIHHWLIYFVLLLLINSIIIISNGSFNAYTNLLSGICIGSILHGFKYSDMFQIETL